ncbi:MAG: hypothetical protein ACLS6W_07735 [Ruminococcus sp.]
MGNCADSGIGGLLSPERKLFPKYSKGLYTKDGKYLYVNCGLESCGLESTGSHHAGIA